MSTPLKYGVKVITVYHSIDAEGCLMWQTVICHGPLDGYEARYRSLRNARIGHKAAAEMARGEMHE